MSGSYWKKRVKIFATIFLALSLVVACYVTVFGAPEEDEVVRFQDAKTAIEVMYLLNVSYYKEISVGSLIAKYLATGTIDGMLEVLGTEDPYTRHIKAKEYEVLRAQNDGIYGGVGIVIGIRNSVATVINPISGTPAMKAGIKSGDKILMVDGQSTEDMVLDVVSSLLRGEAGTTVTVLIDSNGVETEIELVREIINNPATTKFMIDDKIGYIELTTFSRQAGAEMQADLNYLLEQGMEALILDLRNNGGGLVDQAIELASMFIPSGPVMHVQPRNSDVITFYTTSSRMIDIPIVVLVNQYTASASEILAGAMQDTEVATIIGMPTFGKGLVQSIYTLSDGSGMSVTSQIYLTAGKRAITHETPIVPDIEVEIAEIDEEMVTKIDTLLEEYQAKGSLLNSEDLLRIYLETYDTQLREAIDVLTEELAIIDDAA